MEQARIKPGSSPLVRTEIEYLPAGHIKRVPRGISALYVLYSEESGKRYMNVRYVGYANAEQGDDIRALLQKQYDLNGRMWTHFSVYELWDYFQLGDNRAVEALFHQIYRYDSHMKQHIARNRRRQNVDNGFIPKELFMSFIQRIARTSTQLTAP